MRAYVADNEIRIVLSERNLRTGLHKLVMPGSARELQSRDVVDSDGAVLIRLQFEDDTEHYEHPDRHSEGVIGRMHPDTERAIRA